MDPTEEYNFFCASEKSLNKYACKQLNDILRNSSNVTLLRKFNEKFLKDEQGISRNWKEL